MTKPLSVIALLLSGRDVLVLGDARVQMCVDALPRWGPRSRTELVLADDSLARLEMKDWKRLWNLAVIHLLTTRPSLALRVPFSL